MVYRRRTKRAPMTRRRILNVSSRKKQDNMLCLGGTAYFTNPEGPAPLQIPGNKPSGAVIAWICTARDYTTFSGDSQAFGTVIDQATRTAQTCYMRGLKERIEIATNSPAAWRWRRIVFRFKGLRLLQPGLPEEGGKGSAGTLWRETTNGWTRFMADLNRTDAGERDVDNIKIRDNVLQHLFRGAIDVDWNDPQTAKVDTKRVQLMHDYGCTLRSSNDRGNIWVKKRWHAMNKNLVYDDDEIRGVENEAILSTQGAAGMGDVYVIDFIAPGPGATSADNLLFKPQATLYWHER